MRTTITHVLHKIAKQIKKPLIYIPLAIVVIGVGAMAYSSNSNGNGEEVITVTPQDFVQEVAVTGKVVAAQDVQLGFETSGRISRVNVKVGDKVNIGQVLAFVSNGDYGAAVSQRQAIVESEQAKLAEIQRGSRIEDITIAQSDVDSAQTSIDQAKRNVVDQIKDAYVRSDDAVRSKIDQLYSNPRSATPEILSFDTSNVGYAFKEKLNDERLRAGEMLTRWQSSTQSLTAESYTLTTLSEARTNINQMRDFLNNLSVAVSSLQPNTSLTQTTIDKYKSDISQARTNISIAATNLSSAEQSISSYQSALKKAQDQLALKKAGSTQEQINSQIAQVKSAQAQLQSAQAAYAKTLITAPFAGIVTKVDTKAGEIASPNISVISLSSASKYEMESFISETDIAKVKVAQSAKVTLDAYGKSVIFDATVTEVDPAETVLDGVSTYKAKLQFAVDDERIKSGMTANITIQTDSRTAVIVIPQQAIFLKDGEKNVKVIVASGQEDRIVKTGSINNKGDIEVISGISAGERVIVTGK